MKRQGGREFSKIVLAICVGLYIVTAAVGICIIVPNPEHIGELFTFVGAPTAVAIGFYAWKARTENVVKITQALDKNKKMSTQTKQQLISGIAKTLNELETEEFKDGIG